MFPRLTRVRSRLLLAYSRSTSLVGINNFFQHLIRVSFCVHFCKGHDVVEVLGLNSSSFHPNALFFFILISTFVPRSSTLLSFGIISYKDNLENVTGELLIVVKTRNPSTSCQYRWWSPSMCQLINQSISQSINQSIN